MAQIIAVRPLLRDGHTHAGKSLAFDVAQPAADRLRHLAHTIEREAIQKAQPANQVLPAPQHRQAAREKHAGNCKDEQALRLW